MFWAEKCACSRLHVTALSCRCLKATASTEALNSSPPNLSFIRLLDAKYTSLLIFIDSFGAGYPKSVVVQLSWNFSFSFNWRKSWGCDITMEPAPSTHNVLFYKSIVCAPRSVDNCKSLTKYCDWESFSGS